MGEAGCDLVAAHQVHLQLSLPPGLVVAHVAREGVDVDPLQTFKEPNSLFICVQFSQHSEFDFQQSGVDFLTGAGCDLRLHG